MAKGWVKTLITLISSSLLLIACSTSNKDNSKIIPVNYITVKTQTIPVYMDFIGTTKAISTVDIRARVSGFLVERLFKEGDFIKKGQLLYVIDKRPFEAALNEQKAIFLQKVANVIYQEKELIRMKKLIQTAVISQEQYDSTLASTRQAEADVAAARASVESARLNLSYCSMYAPINGKIGQTQINAGNYVNAASSSNILATMVTLDPMYVLFYPSDKDYGKIRQYMDNKELSLKVTVPGDNKHDFYGKLNFVNNEVGLSTSTVTLRGTLGNSNYILLPGLKVNVRVYLSKNPNAILIPQEALQETQGESFVYVVDQNNTVEARKVEKANIYKNQQVIKSGLKVGDKVIVSRTQLLKPGRVVKPEASTQSNQPQKTEPSKNQKDISGTKKTQH